MKSQTEGAWIIHHAKKLQLVVNTAAFDEINTAGKSGILLSALANDSEHSIEMPKVKAISTSAGISKLELDSILNKLKANYLIDGNDQEISVLGLTTTSVLDHTSKLFQSAKPLSFELAALDIAEQVSQKPLKEDYLKEYIGDTHKLKTDVVNDLFNQIEDLSFIDSESINPDDKLFFNGNLFRKEQLKKTNAVLTSLNADESRSINEIDSLLTQKGCIPFSQGEQIAGKMLLHKLHSIGMYDFNIVANDSEKKVFLTKPAAFSKFGNPFEDDALDLAKAFVSSLMYGMVYSQQSRGRIDLLERLMQKLIRGESVGPATAIGQDYRILELKGVVEIKKDPNKSWGFNMRLLKKEIGELALKVLQFGTAASEDSVLDFKSQSVTSYTGPEATRSEARKKKMNKESKTQIFDALNTLRYT